MHWFFFLVQLQRKRPTLCLQLICAKLIESYAHMHYIQKKQTWTNTNTNKNNKSPWAQRIPSRICPVSLPSMSSITFSLLTMTMTISSPATAPKCRIQHHLNHHHHPHRHPHRKVGVRKREPHRQTRPTIWTLLTTMCRRNPMVSFLLLQNLNPSRIVFILT